jgi:hypothetical protein
MVEISNAVLLNTNVESGFGSGEGLAVRSIMLDTIQRYYAANAKGTPAEKMAVVQTLAMEAAREHKNGVHLKATRLGIDLIDDNLTLSAAQKEMAGLAWQKLLSDKDPAKVIGFLEDPELKAKFKDVPPIKSTPVEELNKRFAQAMNNASLADLAAAAVGIPYNAGPVSELKALFEKKAEEYGIMYHKVDDKTMDVETSFKQYIEGVKQDIRQGKRAELDTGVKLAGVTLADEQAGGSAPLGNLAVNRAQGGTQIG